MTVYDWYLVRKFSMSALPVLECQERQEHHTVVAGVTQRERLVRSPRVWTDPLCSRESGPWVTHEDGQFPKKSEHTGQSSCSPSVNGPSLWLFLRRL